MDDLLERPVQIVLSDLGSYGSVVVHGRPLPVSRIEIEVAAQGATVVQLSVLGKYCNVEFDYEGLPALLERLGKKGADHEGEAEEKKANTR